MVIGTIKKTFKKNVGKTYKKKINKKIGNNIPKIKNTGFHKAGREMGAKVGLPALGSVAGQLLGRIFGSGDYKLAFQAKHNTMLSDAVPEFGMSGSANSIRVRHREYIGDVSTSSAYTTQYALNINPGLASTFPWLSQIAASFQKYKMHGMCAVFKSTSGDAVSSTNSAIGSIIMSFNSNATDSLFVNKQQQLECDFVADMKPSVSFIAPLECAKNQQVLSDLYIRQQGLATTQNQNFYDMALLQVSTAGAQTGFTAGELWLTYDVELYAPISSSYGAGFYAHYVTNGNMTTSAYFGNTLTGILNTASNMAGILFGVTAITFPSYITSGNFTMTYVCVGTSGTVSSPNIAFANAKALNLYDGNSIAIISNSGTTSGTLIVQYAFTITGPLAIISLSGGGLPSGTTTYGDILIESIPTIGSTI